MARLRELLARLELTAAGTITSYSPSGRGGAGSRPPTTGDDWPPFLLLEDRIAHAEDLVQLRAAARWGEARLKATVRGPRVKVAEETRAERTERIVELGEGFPAHVVASSLGYTIKQVYEARAAEDRDLLDGKRRRPEVVLTPAQRRERARKMREQGISYTRIGEQLGVHPDTVRRDLGVKTST